jgi:hypothetical protein
MRALLILALLATACTELPSSGPHHDSVLERLSDVPTSLYVHDEASSGSITARRLGADGWIDGTTTLTIEHGYMRAAVDANGQLEITQLDLALAPIAIEGVFQRSARLEGVRVQLAEPVHGDVVWTSANDATASVEMGFDLHWAIVFDDEEPYPLATQHLNAVTAMIVLGGHGDHVDAQLEIDSEGELWNWADLVQFTALSLSVSAETTD